MYRLSNHITLTWSAQHGQYLFQGQLYHRAQPKDPSGVGIPNETVFTRTNSWIKIN